MKWKPTYHLWEVSKFGAKFCPFFKYLALNSRSLLTLVTDQGLSADRVCYIQQSLGE